ncbi:MAG: hypothetical protein R3A51_19270 [Nannocystaceae bacterium]
MRLPSLVFALLWLLAPTRAIAGPAATESNCTDGKDDDGDTVIDCADHDCAADPACQPDGQPEIGEQRCSDWVDNEQDGYTDCDDRDCEGTRACMGSYDLELAGEPVGDVKGGGATADSFSSAKKSEPVVTLKKGQAPEDLLGKGNDKDGEAENLLCSDGIDNDGDGAIDCEDLGCKLTTQVTVCQPSGDFRLSLVSRVAQSFEIPTNTNDDTFVPNTTIDTLQLRVLGQMPFIQNSFFLLSMRVEKTPRMTFAMFQVPIKNGHYVNVNSGGGGLSLELIRSVHKRMLVDPAYYVYNAFEQGNGAAIEFGGPFDKRGKFLYRTFLAGGSGRFAGNIGGVFFPDDNRNFTWSAGAQIHMNLVGYYNRFDSPMLYTPVPLTFTLTIGGKYDQRAQERYPAVNVQSVFRWKRLIVLGEFYGKRELNFKNWQWAYVAQVGVLAWSKRLLLAADFGQYLATDFEQPPEVPGYDLRRQLQELQYRVAAHIYIWRDVFLAQLVWRERQVEPPPGMSDNQIYRDLRLLLMYRW